MIGESGGCVDNVTSNGKLPLPSIVRGTLPLGMPAAAMLSPHLLYYLLPLLKDRVYSDCNHLTPVSDRESSEVDPLSWAARRRS